MGDWHETDAPRETAEIQAALLRCNIRADVPYGFGGFSIDLGDSVLMFHSSHAPDVLTALNRAAMSHNRREAAMEALHAFFRAPEPGPVERLVRLLLNLQRS